LTVIPSEVVTDAASVYPAVPAELVPSAWHHVEQHANNRIEADHGQLKHRLRPMRGLQNDQTAQVVIARQRVRPELAPRPITNSQSTPMARCGSPLRSPNSPGRSDYPYSPGRSVSIIR
jgi:transposase-like protein